MRVFVTGATGFIGSAVVRELVAAGHQVVGLSRSTEKAAALAASGAQVLHGSVEDAEVLRSGVARSDGVIHLAFNHDFSRFVANCEDDRRVIDVLGTALVGSDRPLVVTSGTAIGNSAPGQIALESNAAASSASHPRAATEEAALLVAQRGANVSIVRLPQVHDTTRAGLITYTIAVAREKKLSAYVGDGHHRWPAAHVSDVARLYRLALEKSARGAKYHAVAEEGVSLRDIAEAIAHRFDIPAASIAPSEAAAHFGWLAMFAGLDMPASSAETRKQLGWQPKGRGLMADLREFSRD
jgi:nucleoside-diphosphate-sugar epimerase